jgi:hypothetical protein
MNLKVEHRPSHLDLIAGDFGRPGVSLTFHDPWGNAWHVASGNKTEYGPGGFECGDRPAGNPYTVQAGAETWQFRHAGGGMTFLTWTTGPEPEPEPEPEPPGPEPEPPEPEPPEPEPPGPEPQDIQVLAGYIYSARLQGDIITWHEGKLDDAAWWFVGQHIPGADLWLPAEEPARPMLAAWFAELRQRVDWLESAVARVL